MGAHLTRRSFYHSKTSEPPPWFIFASAKESNILTFFPVKLVGSACNCSVLTLGGQHASDLERFFTERWRIFCKIVKMSGNFVPASKENLKTGTSGFVFKLSGNNRGTWNTEWKEQLTGNWKLCFLVHILHLKNFRCHTFQLNLMGQLLNIWASDCRHKTIPTWCSYYKKKKISISFLSW